MTDKTIGQHLKENCTINDEAGVVACHNLKGDQVIMPKDDVESHIDQPATDDNLEQIKMFQQNL